MTNPIPDRPGTRKKEKREERNVIYGIFNNSDLNANAAGVSNVQHSVHLYVQPGL